MIEQIYIYIIAALPSLGAVIGIVSAVCAIFKKFNSLIKEVKETTDIKQLKGALNRLAIENLELKRLIKKDIEARTHVEVQDDKKV